MPISAPVMDTPAIDRLQRIGHHAGFDQIDQPSPIMPGMHAEIAAVGSNRKIASGYRADAELNHGAIPDITGRDAGDRLIRLADLRLRHLDRDARHLHSAIDARRRQHRIAERKGHALVDLGDDHARLRHGGLNEIADQAETMVAVGVGRAHLDERDVAADQPLLDHRSRSG